MWDQLQCKISFIYYLHHFPQSVCWKWQCMLILTCKFSLLPHFLPAASPQQWKSYDYCFRKIDSRARLNHPECPPELCLSTAMWLKAKVCAGKCESVVMWSRAFPYALQKQRSLGCQSARTTMLMATLWVNDKHHWLDSLQARGHGDCQWGCWGYSSCWLDHVQHVPFKQVQQLIYILLAKL